QAAGAGFVADAADACGDNIPLGGGTYVDTATTVAGATSVAGIAQGTIPVAGTATGVANGGNGGQGGQGGQNGQGGSGPVAGNSGGNGGNADGCGHGGSNDH